MGGDDKISVREFESERDTAAVEQMERRCDASVERDQKQTGKKTKKKKRKEPASLCVDLLGDPLCRVRYFSDRVMLVHLGKFSRHYLCCSLKGRHLVQVAEHRKQKEIVGVVRASIKTVTRGSKEPDGSPSYARVAYILGLRVSSQHRYFLLSLFSFSTTTTSSPSLVARVVHPASRSFHVGKTASFRHL